MRLNSSAFTPGDEIPSRFTCDGAGLAPTFSWSGVPKEARSFALVCSDPDAPSGTFYHWAAFDIPATAKALEEKRGSGMSQAINDFGKRGYGGPCPPRGHGPHHYHFTLYALDVPHLGLAGSPHCREVERAAMTHALATAELIGIYER